MVEQNPGNNPLPEHQVEIEGHNVAIKEFTPTPMFEVYHAFYIYGTKTLEVDASQTEEELVESQGADIYGYRVLDRVRGKVVSESDGKTGGQEISYPEYRSGTVYIDGVIETREEIQRDLITRTANDRKVLLDQLERAGVSEVIHMQRGQREGNPRWISLPLRPEDVILNEGHRYPVINMTEKNKVRDSMIPAREKKYGF